MKKKKTLYLDEEVIKPAEHKAIDEDKSLSQWIEDMIRKVLGLK